MIKNDMFFTISSFFSKTTRRARSFFSFCDATNSDFLTFFSFVWGLYTLLHFQYLSFYSPSTAPEPNILSWLMLFLAICLINKPQSRHVFIALTSVQFFEMVVQLPFPSNHSIIQFFLGLAFISASINLHTLKKNIPNWDEIFIQTGSYLLLIMYIFGIFHKINTDFLNPESSCAVTLWKTYPFPDFIRNGVWAHYLAIYGTFLIEGIVLLSLIIKKARYYGVIIGVSFHIFLGFSSFAYYPAFSMLSIALHTLFLPRSSLDTFRNSKAHKYFDATKSLWPPLSIAIAGLLLLFSYTDYLNGLMALFALLSVPLLLFIIFYTKSEKGKAQTTNPKSFIAIILAILFFLNCLMPYMGLKTRQTLNMFSNLHLENGRSNHLILNYSPRPFKYLEGSVKIHKIEIIGHPEITIQPIKNEVVYHDLLALLDNNEKLMVTFTRNERRYEGLSKTNLQEEIDNIVVSKFLQKWFVFDGVDNTQPKTCQ